MDSSSKYLPLSYLLELVGPGITSVYAGIVPYTSNLVSLLPVALSVYALEASALRSVAKLASLTAFSVIL